MTATIDEQRQTLKELTDGSMAFFREARNGNANVEQANVGSRFANAIVRTISTDLKLRFAEPRLAKMAEGE